MPIFQLIRRLHHLFTRTLPAFISGCLDFLGLFIDIKRKEKEPPIVADAIDVIKQADGPQRVEFSLEALKKQHEILEALKHTGVAVKREKLTEWHDTLQSGSAAIRKALAYMPYNYIPYRSRRRQHVNEAAKAVLEVQTFLRQIFMKASDGDIVAIDDGMLAVSLGLVAEAIEQLLAVTKEPVKEESGNNEAG